MRDAVGSHHLRGLTIEIWDFIASVRMSVRHFVHFYLPVAKKEKKTVPVEHLFYVYAADTSLWLKIFDIRLMK